MISIVIAALFVLWIIIGYLMFFHQPKSNGANIDKKNTDKFIGFFKALQRDSKSIGWEIGYKEWIIIIGFFIILILIVSVVFKNIFILLASVFVIYYLPKFLIAKMKQAKRINLLTKLPDPLRLFVSRLPDQENIVLAAETTLYEISDPDIKELFANFVTDSTVGASIQAAITNMKENVSLKKFNTFADYLMQAHYEGFSKEAISALTKAIESIEFDLRAIAKVKEQSKSKKTKLYFALGIAWLFPFILSFVSTGNSNIYTQTIQGKILIFLYFIGSLVVYVKGEEYLSLSLDEL